MTAWRTLSINARQLLAASLGLVAFLGVTGLALDRAFKETAQSNLQQRLENYAHAYLRNSDFDSNGGFISPVRSPPDPRFDRPGSGLYAVAIGKDFRWESASMLGRTLPAPDETKPGVSKLEGPTRYAQQGGDIIKLFRLSETTIWETVVGEKKLTFAIYEDTKTLDEQIAVFRRALWSYLGMAGVLLLLLQVFVMRWTLMPLRQLEGELKQVQNGSSQGLKAQYPPELEPIAGSLNAFIESERSGLEQSRNTLSDLAHSLKTPLAVLRARLEADAPLETLRGEVQAQTQRMNEIVSYQLTRAARSGHALFSTPIEIEPRALEIVQSLEKVYQSKGVVCEFEIDSASRFNGELGDLQELLGNLLENAFKWAKSKVLLSVSVNAAPSHRRAGVIVMVEDDGPGIPPQNVERLLQRGVRGDERVQGHGIGLAIVQDIVLAYRGELSVNKSEELHGAKFTVRIPPVF
jgi:two-component system, OmpR family, sensor histidine kinase PhoQ